MKNLFLFTLISVITIVLGFAGYAKLAPMEIPPVPEGLFIPVKKSMRAFRSDQELRNYLKELAEKQKREARREVANKSAEYMSVPNAQPSVAGIAATDAKEESVTNVQHAGVDEGGIVKCMVITSSCCVEGGFLP